MNDILSSVLGIGGTTALNGVSGEVTVQKSICNHQACHRHGNNNYTSSRSYSSNHKW